MPNEIANSVEAPVPGAPALVEIDAVELRRLLTAGQAVLIDVRDVEEYAEEHIPGALHIPLAQLDPETLPRFRDKRLILHCLTGGRSAKAGACLLAAGVGEAAHLPGGILAWKAAGGATRSAAA